MSAPAPAPLPPGGGAPEPAPVELTEFYCNECESSVSLPVSAAHPSSRRRPCPICRVSFLEPGPSPFAEVNPPPPGVLPATEDSAGPVEPEELEELEDVEFADAAEARLYIASFIQERLHAVAAPEDIAAATAAAISLLDQHQLRGEPSDPMGSIVALPSVEVSDAGAACPVCLDELLLASSALKLPCSHLYHSSCIAPRLRRHNTCPMCRSRVVDLAPDLQTTATITILLTTAPRRRVRVNDGAVSAEAPVSSSATQLAQAGTEEGGGGPANSGDTVSSEWPPPPDSDTVMSEARDGDGSFD